MITLNFLLTSLIVVLIPGTGVIYIDAENDGTYVSTPMNQISANLYEATFPAVPCGRVVRYYVTAQSTTSSTVADPNGAPASYYTALAATSTNVVFQDTFETNQGWVATVNGATTGQWQRGVPANGGRGDPPVDSNDAGTQCYLTQNAAGDTDVDGGSVILTSPTMNASGGGEAILSYARWYDNTGAGTGGNPGTHTFDVAVSNNNGSSWVALESVGPATSESSGGWYYKSFPLSTVLPLTSQMKVRFTASDSAASPAVVEAAVDAVKLETVICLCPSDFDQNGFVNGDDFDSFIAAFEAGSTAADFDHNTFVNGDDFDAFVLAFEAGC